jgi:hypothetical protein
VNDLNLIQTLFDIAKSSVIKKRNMAEQYETQDIRKKFLKYEEAYYNYSDRYTKEQRQEIIDDYVEENEYYRMLNAKPPLGEEGVKLTDDIINEVNEDTNIIDQDKYVHEMSKIEINIMLSNGMMDLLIEKYPDKKYLTFLHSPIPYIISRKAEPFDLMATKNVYSNNANLIATVYNEAFAKVKRHFINTIYNEYYHYNYDYYEEVMVNYIILAAIIESVNQLNMDNMSVSSLSADNLKHLFQDYGLPSNMNLPYNLATKLAASLNSLTRHKGDKKAIIDISEIFNLNIIYRYYLHKRPSDNVETLPNDASNENKFTLEFVKVPFGDKDIHQYLSDPNNVIPYDEFVRDDETWGDDTEAKLYDSDFSMIETKYMSIEDLTDITRTSFKTSLFFQHFLKSNELSRNLMFQHRYLDSPISLFDLIVYLTSLMITKRGYVDEIYYDFDTVSHLIGMNDEFDEKEIIHELKYLFSDKEFEETIQNDIEFLDTEDEDISIRNVMEKYVGNMDVIYLIEQKMFETEDYRRYSILKKIFDSLTIIETNNNIYGQAETYSDYLRGSNLELYERMQSLIPSMNEINPQEYHLTAYEENQIIDEIAYIIEIMEDVLAYFDNDEPPIALEFFTDIKQSELDRIKTYLYQVVNFFKSHTNHLMDLTVSYRVDDPFKKIKVLEELEIMDTYEYEDSITELITNCKIHYIELTEKMYSDTIDIKESVQISDTNKKGGFDYYEN